MRMPGLRSSVSCLLSLLLSWLLAGGQVLSRAYRLALPGYQYRFPRDHASHDDFKTEWWYYTGHLEGANGGRYGYELTFFRLAVDVPNRPAASPWSVDNVYLAHFAVSDLGKRTFFYDQRLNRAGLGMSGADTQRYKVWNQNWSVVQEGGRQHLRAASRGYRIDLALMPEKPLVMHGQDGVSQKASCVGCASHYYSFTRLKTAGLLIVDGKSLPVSGISWMDHEFGSNQLTSRQVGWDWFSIQLDNNCELMLYSMRKEDGSVDENSSGTFVYADGSSRHLKLSDYRITVRRHWRSNLSRAQYPMGWDISIPSRKLHLAVVADLENQELVKRKANDVTYWEGAATVSGATGDPPGLPVSGQAYVEMTGYAESFKAGI